MSLTATTLSTLLYHGYDGTGGFTGFVNEGTWVIFALILVPVYIMLIAWFVTKPKNVKSQVLGVTYLVGLTTMMWGGMFVLTMIIGVLFYGGLPEPIGAPGP